MAFYVRPRKWCYMSEFLVEAELCIEMVKTLEDPIQRLRYVRLAMDAIERAHLDVKAQTLKYCADRRKEK